MKSYKLFNCEDIAITSSVEKEILISDYFMTVLNTSHHAYRNFYYWISEGLIVDV